MTAATRFPDGFVWGAATSSFQIEGAADRRARSIWDEFCDTPGTVANGETGKLACRHIDRLDEDLALIRDLGLNAYRFSISWPRVARDGDGSVYDDGLAFYDRLVDGLLEIGCQPFCTLYHWDMPAALQRRGGWLNPDSPQWFEHYSHLVAERLGDRIRHWVTFNEPQVFLHLGLTLGTHAPGLKLPIADVVRAAHHVLVAHGRSTAAIRAHSPDCQIGLAPVGITGVPAKDTPEDLEAARRLTLGVISPDTWNNTWHLDPVFKGEYPDDGLAHFGQFLPRGFERDMDHIAQPLDFLGLNVYTAPPVSAGKDGEIVFEREPVGIARTSFNWTVEPRSLYYATKFLHERYQHPIYITENGLANNDWVMRDGRVHDPQRIDYTARYLRELHRAIDDGADVRGYFHWSLMDNFEWAEGYTKRFGLVHVNFETGDRTPKESYRWYRDVIVANDPDARPAHDLKPTVLRRSTDGPSSDRASA